MAGYSGGAPAAAHSLKEAGAPVALREASGSFDHVFTPKHRGTIHDNYELADILGEGSFGRIFRGRSRATSDPAALLGEAMGCSASPKESETVRAIKTISIDVTSTRFGAEVEVQQQLDHPNVARLYEVFQDKVKYYLVLELCTGGELFDKAVAAGGMFSEGTCALYMRQLLAAVNYLHFNHVAHRDIKPENLLLHSSAADAPLKLIDFGCSRTFEDGKLMTTCVGTPLYIAPQVLKRAYDQRCDVWSCGVIMYVLLCGSAPFIAASQDDLLKKIELGFFEFDDDDWEDISDSARDVVARMLTVDASKRPTAAELLEDAWLTTGASGARDSLPAGLVTRLRTFVALSQFKKISLSMAAQLADDDNIKELQSTFMSLDQNKDGMLSHREIREGLASHGVVLPSNITAILDQVDTNASGSISYTEFIASTITRKQYLRDEVLWNVFRTFDLDGDGKIQRQEFEQVVKLSDREDIARIYEEADLSGDGQIDFFEFCTMMRKKAKIKNDVEEG